MHGMTNRLTLLFRSAYDYLAISRSGLFDAEWYLKNNADIATAGLNPLWHYVRHGATEGRAPSRDFDTRWYRDTYLSAFPVGTYNPLVHYERFGRRLSLKGSPAHDRTHPASHSPAPPSSDPQSIRLAEATSDSLGEAGKRKLGLIALGDRTSPGIDRLHRIGVQFAALGGQTITLSQEDAIDPLFARLGSIIRTDGSALGNVRWAPLADVARRIRSPRPSLFIAASPLAALSVGDRLRLSGARLAVLIDERLSRKPAAENALLFENCDALVFSSQAAFDNAKTLPGFPTERSVVEPFQAELPSSEVPTRTSKTEELTIVGGGECPVRDGLDLFIAMAARVLEVDSKARFKWVGPVSDETQFMITAREDIARYGLLDRFHFVGERSHIASELQDAHILALLSRDNLSVRPLSAAASTRTHVICFAGATAAESVLGGHAVTVPFGRIDTAATEALRLRKVPPAAPIAAPSTPFDFSEFLEDRLGWNTLGEQGAS